MLSISQQQKFLVGDSVHKNNAQESGFELFPWHSDFETGFSELDGNHHGLVDILNRVAVLFASNTTENALTRIFDDISVYLEALDLEEKFWRVHFGEDRRLQRHARAHAGLNANIAALRAEQLTRSINDTLESLFSLLARWFTVHVLGEDMHFAKAVSFTGEGHTLEQCWQMADDAMLSEIASRTSSVHRIMALHTLEQYAELCSGISSSRLIEQNLRMQRDMQRLISEFASGFLRADSDGFDAAVNQVLEHSGKFLEADRAYVFVISEDGARIRNTHEWCSDGAQSFIAELQNCSTGDTPWWWKELKESGMAVVNDVDAMPAEAAFEQAMLQAQKVKSMCVFASRHAGRINGFVGFDAVGRKRVWSKELLEFAALLGDIVGIAFGHQKIRQALKLSETRYRTMFESLNEAIIVSDTETYAILAANNQTAKITGRSVEELTALNLRSLHPPEFHDKVDSQVERCKQLSGSESMMELPLVRPDGSIIPIEVSGAGCYRENGRTLIMATFRDMTEQKRIELEKSQALVDLKRAEQMALVGNWMLDPVSAQMKCSDGVFRILEMEPTETLAFGAFQQALHPDDRARVFEALRATLDRFEPFMLVHRIKLPDGRIRHIEVRGEATRGADGTAEILNGTVQDVTERIHHQQQLERIAYYDTLTNLPNRARLTERLNKVIEEVDQRGGKVIVCVLDIDDFKNVNDRYGQALGDQLLNKLGKRLQDSVRKYDIVARLGGDEFALVFNELNANDLSVPRLTAILEAVAKPVPLGKKTVQISASLGVTTHRGTVDNEMDADLMLRQAQQALYQAKLAGKNRYSMFDADLEYETRFFHKSLQEIRRALEKREFVVYYQPKINMRSGDIFGVEALIRWQHPQRGLLAPAEFLPVVKNHPLGIELDEWVMSSVLDQLEAWRAEGIELTASVNVTAHQLQQDDFVLFLRNLLDKHPELPAGKLELEVLESSAMNDIAQVSSVMHASQALGVHFALDDFGTGYSSLTYLKSLPASIVKIDQSFVRGMLDHPDDLAIIKGVLGMATAFDLQVIAEGVETVAHGEMLLRLGCNLAQGYGISAPMPADLLTKWMRTWKLYPEWNQLEPIGSDKLPLLDAEVEIRAWIRMVEEAFNGKYTPSGFGVEHTECSFGRWLRGAGRHRYGSLKTFESIEFMHHQVHELAKCLLDSGVPLHTPQQHKELQDFYILRDNLLGALDEMIKTDPQEIDQQAVLSSYLS